MFSRKKKKKEKPLLSCPFCGNAFEDVTDHISQCVGVNKNTSPKHSSSAVQPPSDSQPQPQPVPVVPTKEPAPVPAPANPLNTSPQKQVSPPVIEAKVEVIVAVAPQVQEPVAPVVPAKFESENKESEASKNTTDLNSDEDEEDSGETPDFPVGVVLFDHEQGSEVEISVTEGQHVFILDSSDSDWIYIGFDGKEGFIPANYLEPVKDKPNTPSEKTASLIKSENLQNLSTSAPGVINRSAVPVKEENSLAASSSMDTAPAEKQPEMLKSRVKQVAANSAPGRANSTPTTTFPPIENSESSVPSQRSLVPPKKVKSSKIGSFSSIGSTLRSRKKKKPAEFTIARADTQVTPITSQTPPGSPMESHSREIETDGPVEPAPTPVVASAPPEPAAPPPVPVDQRTNIAKEILSTELHYLNIIESLVNRYKDTLIRRLDLYSNSISKEQIVDIFGNLDMIIPINKQLCEDLRKVLESWNSTSTIGDIFVHVAPFLKMYNQYSNHYDQALNTLIKCMKNEDFSELVEEIDRTSKLGARLDSLLIAPIQRIPRYNLLLQELRKSTPHAHEDIEFLDKAIPLMQQVANYINSNMSAVENQEKLLSLSLAGAQSLLKPHRILLHEGIVTRDGKKKLHVWLFNDIIVLLPDNMAKNKEHLNRPEYQWPLHLVWLGSYLVKNKKESMFSLVGPTTAYSILCLNEEVQDWTSKIENAIRGHLEYLSRTQDVELTEEKKANMSYDNPKRYGSFTFPNGAEYSGWWNNGEFDGAGTFSFFNSTYVGTFVKGQRQGQGVLNYVTGEVYEGEWANDKQNGQGVLTYPNGDVYDGHWLDGMKHGKGSLVCTLGDSYMGEWAKDMPQGLGEMCYRSGKLYNGNWENGMQHHYGILICPDGEKYEGDWIAGVRHGKGRMEYFTDCYYDGYWSHGCKHGKGTFVSPEGTYEGEWVMDMKEGTGTMTYRDGKVYKGLWKKNFYHGQGTLTHPSGFIECYIGEWQNQKRHGSGILRMFNGDMYEGHFKDNKFHGTGSYSFGNGNTIKCKWSKGCITGECTFTMPPKVTDTHKDQYTYIGTYKDGKLTAPDRPPIHIRTIPAGEIDLM